MAPTPAPQHAGTLILALASALGCRSFAPPLTCPAREGAPWIELTSRHLVMQTDLDLEDARDAAVAFEHTYDALTDLAIHVRPDVVERIHVVLFDREKDYRQFGPPAVDGYFDAWLPSGIEQNPKIVLFGDLTEQTRISFQHQLTHHLVQRSLGRLPTWLEEGLALYYATLRIDGDRAYFGQPVPSEVLGIIFGQRRTSVAREVHTSIEPSHFPTVARLFAAAKGAFYERPEITWNTKEEELERQAVHCLGSWALVHMLMSGPQTYQLRFRAFIADVAGGAAAAEAWKAHFGDIDLDAFEQEYHHHVAYGLLPDRDVPYTPRKLPLPERERLMTDAEVHLLWARLFPWQGAWMTRVRAELDHAIAQDPRSADVRLWKGLFDTAEGRFTEGERALCAAQREAPEDFRYGLALARLYAEQARRNAPPVSAPRGCPP
jgi:hypothetical protein